MIAVRRLAAAAGLATVLVAGCGVDAGTSSAGSPSPLATPAQGEAQDRPTGSATASANGVVPCDALGIGSAAPAAPVEGGWPDVTLDCLGAGPAVRLTDLRGKPAVVNVWAQWCGPCRQEAPYLADLADRAAAARAKGAADLRVLGIDYADPRPEAAIAFATEQHLDYPHVRDPDKQVGPALRIVGPPATAFVTADGTIAYLHLGPFTSTQQVLQLVKDKLGVAL